MSIATLRSYHDHVRDRRQPDFDVGHWVRDGLSLMPITDAQLAKGMGVGSRTVSLWRRGLSTPRPNLYLKLRSYFLGQVRKRLSKLERSIALPDKLSDLMTLALRDLAWVEKRKAYTVDMALFYNSTSEVCTVCFAGAVMACTGELGTTFVAEELPWSPWTWSKFQALDMVRKGFLLDALELMGQEIPPKLPHYIRVPEYVCDRTGWKRAMRSIRRTLKTHNL